MSTRKLLILDDDPLIGQTIEAIARSIDFEARFTTDADKFFRQVTEWSPTHIALDLVMPDMDGVEVLVELARRQVKAQIIITSGVGNRVLDAAARSAREHGLPIAGVVSKPFSPAAFRELLNRSQKRIHIVSSESGSDKTGEEDVTPEELKDGLDRQELELVYQPKVHCRTGVLAGFETLARWTSPRRGELSPHAFIPLAEEFGMAGQLTRQVIESSFGWFARGLVGLQDAGQPGESRREALDRLTLSINLSARALDDVDFIDYVVDQCRQHDLDSQRIVFELTESSTMEDPVASLDLLTRLRMKGFQLSIDDFGTGYSSMLQLVRLPFSEIKIDKSFVMSAPRSEESRAVIRSIVELGHSLGLRATAEGVEDAETLDYLNQIDCDLAQGFLISRPMKPDQACQWGLEHLESWR